MVAGLGGLGLIMVGAGVGGIMRTAIAQRGAEIGLRRAVGGGRGRAVRDILRELVVPLLVAAWIGLGTSIAAGHALTALFPGSSGFAVSLYLGAVSVLVLAALLGAIGPACRAASLPPAPAIRWGEGVAGGGLL